MMKKMQYLSRLLALLAGSFWITACSNGEDIPPATQEPPMEFWATIADDVPGALTRSTVDNSFEEGDLIALNIQDYFPKNYQYVSGRFVVQNPAEAEYWDGAPFILDVKAVYPASYSGLLSNGYLPSLYTVEKDQSSDDSYKGCDLLYAYSQELQQRNPTLPFRHILSKIVINIRQGGYTGNADISSVTLHGLTEQANVRVNGMNWTIGFSSHSGTTTDIAAHKATTPSTGMVATFEALVIPGQTLANGVKFATIKVDGNYKDFIYNLNKEIILAQGTKYTFNLTLTSQQTVTVNSITAGDWGDGGSHNLETE